MADNKKEVIYVVETSKQEDSLKTYNMITYALYGIGFFSIGLPWIIAVIMNYVKADDAKGTIYESHIGWQIRTFWWSLMWTVIAYCLIITFFGAIIGAPMLIGTIIWAIYRVIKGFIKLNDNQPID